MEATRSWRPVVEPRRRGRWRPSMLLAAVLWVWVASCTDEPRTLRGSLCRVPGCAPGCEALEVEPCDVEERSCQELVFQSVRCVHGGALQSLPVTTAKGRDQFSEEVTERIQEQRDPDRLLEGQYIDRALRLFGLLAADRTGDAELASVQSSAAAVFSSDDESVTVVQMGPQWVAMKTLAHEYVHAQQQASYPGGIMGLFSQAPQTQAGAQAVQAFIEGEAVLYEWLTFAFMRQTPIEEWKVEAYFDLTLQDYRRAAAATVSPWYPARAWLHYPVGALYLLEVYRRGGHEAVQRVRRQIPPLFTYWMHGYPPEARLLRERAAGLRCAAPETAAGFKWIAADELGPSGVFAVAARHSADGRLATESAWRLAKALRSDALGIYAQERTETPLAVRQLRALPPAMTESLETTAHLRAWFRGAPGAAAGVRHASAGVFSLADDAAGVGDETSGNEVADGGARLMWPPDGGLADGGSFSEGGFSDAGASDGGAPDGGAGKPSELQPGGQVLVAWRLRFSDVPSAKQFEAVAMRLGVREVRRLGAELLLMASDRALPAAWSEHQCW